MKIRLVCPERRALGLYGVSFDEVSASISPYVSLLGHHLIELPQVCGLVLVEVCYISEHPFELCPLSPLAAYE